jgi:hypothetical protein
MHDPDDQTEESLIPLLEDVVEPAELPSVDNSIETAQELISNRQSMLEVVRQGIVTQLSRELKPLFASAVAKAVDQATAQARQALLDELNATLESQLQQLIEQALDQELKRTPSEQNPRDNPN